MNIHEMLREVTKLEASVARYAKKSAVIAAMTRAETDSILKALEFAPVEPLVPSNVESTYKTAQEVYSLFQAGLGTSWLAEVAPELEKLHRR